MAPNDFDDQLTFFCGEKVKCLILKDFHDILEHTITSPKGWIVITWWLRTIPLSHLGTRWGVNVGLTVLESYRNCQTHPHKFTTGQVWGKGVSKAFWAARQAVLTEGILAPLGLFFCSVQCGSLISKHWTVSSYHLSFTNFLFGCSFFFFSSFWERYSLGLK